MSRGAGLPVSATPTADPAAVGRPPPSPAAPPTAAPLPPEAPDPPFRHLIEQMQEGAVTLSPEGLLSYANRRVAELLGLPPGQVLGQNLAAFIAPSDGPAWRRLLAKATRTGCRGELTLLRTDGVEVPIFASLNPLADAGGRTLLCGVLTDLTQHKLRLHAADEANRRLRRLIAEREQAEDALRHAQKMQAIGQLTGGIAHDFNNMLQGFASGVELMRRRLAQNRPEEALRYLDGVLRGIDRAASLTQRLLAFSRRQTLLPQPIDPNALLQDMAGLLRQTVGPDIALALRPEPGCAPMLCDRVQLESALVNLALNARDAMLPRGGGTLTVTIETISLAKAQLVGFAAARPGRFVCITMADTGTGMSEDVLARAFDPFFTTRPAGSGTGLGLSQVWGFVAQSGGVLRAVSAPGQGAIFHLYLPCAPGGPAPIPASTLPATPPCPHIPRALLVDDEPQVRDALAEALGDLGWHVQQAATGAEALEKLRAGPAPDILVADIGLPGGMNGRQLAEAARALYPALPILLITGYAGTALGPGRPLPEGAQLLHKPFTLGVLAGRVQALVSGQR